MKIMTRLAASITGSFAVKSLMVGGLVLTLEEILANYWKEMMKDS